MTQLFAEPYVVPEEEDREEREHLTRAEWWEVFFFIRKLSAAERQRIVDLLQEHMDGEVGTPHQCPHQVWTGTFGKLRRGKWRSDSFRGPQQKSLECSKMQELVICQLQEVQDGGRV